MEFKDAIDFFNNYKDHVKSKNKVTIGYGNVSKMVEAFELLEGHIQDLTEDEKDFTDIITNQALVIAKLNEEVTRKQNLIDVQNKLIKSLQCCGNCIHYSLDKCSIRDCTPVDVCGDESCKKWESGIIE